MKLFKENITPRLSTLGDKIYPLVVDIKKGVKSGEAVNFVTADNEVGILSIELVNGDEPYDISGCIVCGTIQRPDTSTLNVYCDIVGANKLEIPLGVSGTYQEGIHNFDLKIYRGNEKVIGVPTMSYTVTGSLSSDGVVEGDDRLPVLTMVLDNAHDKLVRLDKAIAGATNDLEVKEARDGEVTLNARLERDLAKGKIHFVDVEGSNISTESEEGYLENIEILGNTWQDINNLSDIRSVGTKVEGQELYEIPVLSCGKNLFNGEYEQGVIASGTGTTGSITAKENYRSTQFIKIKPNTTYVMSKTNRSVVTFYNINKVKVGDIYATTFTTPENAIYLRAYYYNPNLTEIGDKDYFQLEEGTQATAYEPYQEDKLTILSPTQLEKVGDVADRIICKDGVWGVEKNIGEVVLNGSEDWVHLLGGVGEQPNSTAYGFTLSSAKGLDLEMDGYSTKLPYNKSLGTIDDVECFKINSSKGLYIRILKSRLQSVSELKKWLQTNNILVIYQLAQPQFIPLPHDQQVKLRTFAGQTHISFETEIEPTLKAQVPKSLGATVNSHTTQIDNLNKELDRVKKLEESTVSTLTTDKGFTTIAETNQGYFEDVKVEGKTLVNKILNNHKVLRDLEYTGIKYVDYQVQVKPSTEYTVVLSISKNTSSPNTSYNWGVYIDGVTQENHNICKTNTSIINVGGVLGVYALKFTTKDSITNSPRMVIGLHREWGVYEFEADVMLLEGDHTDKDISYFEGLKSVGQGTNGEVEDIVVESVKGSGNLFDEDNAQPPLIEYHEGRRCMRLPALNYSLPFGDIKFKENTQYSISFYGKKMNSIANLLVRVHYSDGTKSDLITIDNKDNFTKYVGITLANKTVDYIDVHNGVNGYDNYSCIDLDTLVINEGIEPISYTPIRNNKKPLLYFNPTTETWEKPVLREWDSIEKHSDGKYYYHKRSGEVVLNGSENWALNSTFSTDTHTTSQVQVKGAKFKGDSICDMFNKLSDSSYGQFEGVGIAYQNYIYLSISNTKLSTQDLKGFKAWLQANPVTVVYQLAQGEVYECTNLDLITYSGETNLIVSSGAIQPKLELKVLSNVSNVVKLLQEKVSMLENKFIKGLQQVLAGDMMSLAHLLYPEDFENNHEIQTLEL